MLKLEVFKAKLFELIDHLRDEFLTKFHEFFHHF